MSTLNNEIRRYVAATPKFRIAEKAAEPKVKAARRDPNRFITIRKTAQEGGKWTRTAADKARAETARLAHGERETR